jgi:hypothetical protein
MIEQDGKYYYSQSHHNYKVLDNGKMIDGGRQYVKTNAATVLMRIHKGKFVAKDLEDLIDYYQPGQDCQE